MVSFYYRNCVVNIVLDQKLYPHKPGLWKTVVAGGAKLNLKALTM